MHNSHPSLLVAALMLSHPEVGALFAISELQCNSECTLSERGMWVFWRICNRLGRVAFIAISPTLAVSIRGLPQGCKFEEMGISASNAVLHVWIG